VLTIQKTKEWLTPLLLLEEKLFSFYDKNFFGKKQYQGWSSTPDIHHNIICQVLVPVQEPVQERSPVQERVQVQVQEPGQVPLPAFQELSDSRQRARMLLSAIMKVTGLISSSSTCHLLPMKIVYDHTFNTIYM
jgi:hypothetical protein